MDTVSHLTVTRADLEKFKTENKVENLLIPDDGQMIDFGNIRLAIK